MLVTAVALVALAVVIAVGPNGPARLWLDGGGSTVNLKPRDGTTRAGTLPDGPAALLPGSPASGPVSGVSLASPVAAADRPGAVRLRANTRVQRRTAGRTPARTPAASRPNTPAPAGTPSPAEPISQSTATTAAPVATPAPASSVVKSRGRGTAPAKTEVPKERVPNRAASPAPAAAPPTSESPSPSPRSAPTPAPVTQMRHVQGGSQPSTGVGAADGVLHRVAPTHP